MTTTPSTGEPRTIISIGSCMTVENLVVVSLTLISHKCSAINWGVLHVKQFHTRKIPNYYEYKFHTPWCGVLLGKVTGLQLVKKFPAFYGTRRFITALTSARYLSLSWASPIQSTYPHPTSWRSIPILSTHRRLGLK